LIGIAPVCGTQDDPQGYDQQCRVLQENGFILTDSNARAVRLAAAVVGIRGKEGNTGLAEKGMRRTPPHPTNENAMPEVPAHLPALLATGPRVINLGLELFVTQLTACGVPVVHVDWRPPAGGDTRLASLLERLR
jgi:FdrA protein